MDVAVDVVGQPLGAAGEQGAGVDQYDRVVVGVDNARLGRDRLGDLVDVRRCGDAGADVEELADAGLCGQEADRPTHERPV